jgi:hypothetical protein
VAYYTDFICVQRVFDNEHVAGSQGHLILGIIYERGPIRSERGWIGAWPKKARPVTSDVEIKPDGHLTTWKWD